MRKSARNASASAISSARTAARSVVAADTLRGRTGAMDALAMAEPPPAPGLQQVDREQDAERERQHDDRDRGGAGVVELLQLDDDEHRRDLRHVRQIAGDEDDRA